jgi:phosphohistidine phosphatase
MNLYILRHGHASLAASCDFYRELDVRGRQEVHRGGEKLGSVDLQLIISSPLIRARQSAQIVLDVLALETEIEQWSEITPSGSPKVILNRLAQLEQNTVLLVSHQPLVSRLVEFITDEKIFLDTADVVGIEMDILQQHCGRIIMQKT